MSRQDGQQDAGRSRQYAQRASLQQGEEPLSVLIIDLGLSGYMLLHTVFVLCVLFRGECQNKDVKQWPAEDLFFRRGRRGERGFLIVAVLPEKLNFLCLRDSVFDILYFGTPLQFSYTYKRLENEHLAFIQYILSENENILHEQLKLYCIQSFTEYPIPTKGSEAVQQCLIEGERSEPSDILR